jgi:hypothetical protein
MSSQKADQIVGLQLEVRVEYMVECCKLVKWLVEEHLRI